MAQYADNGVNLGYNGQDTYCPFLMVESNGTEPIGAVTLLMDGISQGAPVFGFMDIYTVNPGVSVTAFACDKDTGLLAAASDVNTGTMGQVRGGKGTRSDGEQVLVEWNDATVAAITDHIAEKLSANKLTLDEAVSLGALKIGYQLQGASDSASEKVVNLETVWCDNDWAEGDGPDRTTPFNWTAGTKAATWANAQDAWKDDGGKVRDPSQVVAWVDPAGGPGSVTFGQLQGTAGPSLTGTIYGGRWNSVDLPKAFWRDLLYNLQGEGGGTPTNYDCVGIRQYGNGWGNDDDWEMLTKEGGAAPRLVITIIPVKGDANIDGKVDVLDLTVVANHFGAKTASLWTDADFNRDGEVDVLDLVIFANRYGWASSTVGGGGGPAPEPATLALLAAGACLTLIRRRRSA